MEASEWKLCGAKTRAGTPCQRAPMRNGRCYLHGGASRSGYAHPNFKHGLYTKSPLIAFEEKRKLLIEKQTAKMFREFDRWVAARVEITGIEPTPEEVKDLFMEFARQRVGLKGR